MKSKPMDIKLIFKMEKYIISDTITNLRSTFYDFEHSIYPKQFRNGEIRIKLKIILEFCIRKHHYLKHKICKEHNGPYIQ